MKTILFNYKLLFMIFTTLPLAMCSNDDNIIEETETHACDNKPIIHIEQLGENITEPYINGGFGRSIALNGNGKRLVVGSPFANTIGKSAGKVTVYEFKDGIWQKMGNDILGRGDNHKLGYNVSINEEGNVIGAIGPVPKVYQFDGTDWVQLGGSITESDGEPGSNSGGLSMDYKGTRIAVGSPTFEPNPTTVGLKRGGVRIYDFSRDKNEWKRASPTLWIKECGNCLYAGGDQQVSLSSDGNRVALGAYYTPPNSVSYNRVNVYEYFNNNWDLIDSRVGSGYNSSRISLNADGTKMTRSALANGWKGNISLYHVGSETNIIDTDYNAFDNSFFGISHSISGDGKRFVVYEPIGNANGGNKNGVTRLYFQVEDKICQVIEPLAGNILINNSRSGTWSYGQVSMSSDGKYFAVSSPKISNNQYDGIIAVYEIKED